jgi:hypothetical protein
MSGMMLQNPADKGKELVTHFGEKEVLSTGPPAAWRAVHTSAGLLDPGGQFLHQVVHKAPDLPA